MFTYYFGQLKGIRQSLWEKGEKERKDGLQNVEWNRTMAIIWQTLETHSVSGWVISLSYLIVRYHLCAGEVIASVSAFAIVFRSSTMAGSMERVRSLQSRCWWSSIIVWRRTRPGRRPGPCSRPPKVEGSGQADSNLSSWLLERVAFCQCGNWINEDTYIHWVRSRFAFHKGQVKVK